VLPCTESDSSCTSGGGSVQAEGPLDAEKADMVAGMVQLIASTAGADSRLRSRGTAKGGGTSSGGPRAEGGDGPGNYAEGRSNGTEGSGGKGGSTLQGGEGHAAADGACANPEGTASDAAAFDALERQAAAARFVRVADAEAAAAYGAQWKCQGTAAATGFGKGSRALTAAAGAVAAASQRSAQVVLRQMAVPVAWVLQAAQPVINWSVIWLPAPVRAATADLLVTLSASLRGGASDSDGAPEEWWKRDPHRRPSLLTPQGWRRLAAGALSRLPTLQALLLSLSRAVPGFADFVLLFHRHEALCATYPPSADIDTAYRTQT